MKPKTDKNPKGAGAKDKYLRNLFTPIQIKTLRLLLGLTQKEAGRIIGGGPRAWSKYERGVIRPSGSMLRMMLLLNLDPKRLEVLTKEFT